MLHNDTMEESISFGSGRVQKAFVLRGNGTLYQFLPSTEWALP